MSALIWLAIVAVWGFVLIPMWLRHHDSATEQRSAERFTTAMRVLSRRGAPRPEAPRPEAPRPEFPRPEAAGASTEDLHEAGATPVPRLSSPTGRVSVADSQGQRGRGDFRGTRGTGDGSSASRRLDVEQTALVRLRRQRLFVLLATSPVSLALAVVLGGTWTLVHLLSDTGLVAYLVHLRRAAQAERRLRASRAARDRRIAAERASRGSSTVFSPASGAVAASASAAAAAVPSPPLSQARTQGGTQAATAVTSPAAWNHPPAGMDAESAARWASEYEPVRLSDTIDAEPPDGELTEAERAVAQAETVDLSTLVDAARERIEAGERARADEAEADAAAEGGRIIDGDVEASHIHGAGHDAGDDSVGYHSAGMVGEPAATDAQPAASGGDELDEYEGGRPGSGGRSSSGRLPARPPVRPNTSKPGRVQINPPGTHGGLIAPPGAGAPAAAPASTPASSTPVPASASTPATPAAEPDAAQRAAAASGDPDELEELLRRHAVGS